MFIVPEKELLTHDEIQKRRDKENDHQNDVIVDGELYFFKILMICFNFDDLSILARHGITMK
jgi:acid stress-induced BolA-like protein IbaG/YrbA